jgi:hypothetical protein
MQQIVATRVNNKRENPVAIMLQKGPEYSAILRATDVPDRVPVVTTWYTFKF